VVGEKAPVPELAHQGVRRSVRRRLKKQQEKKKRMVYRLIDFIEKIQRMAKDSKLIGYFNEKTQWRIDDIGLLTKLPKVITIEIPTSRKFLDLIVALYNRDRIRQTQCRKGIPTMIQIGTDVQNLKFYQLLDCCINDVVVGIVAPIDNTLPPENNWTMKELEAFYGT